MNKLIFNPLKTNHFQWVILVALLVISSSTFGQTPTITLNASQTNAYPNDKIKLTWKINDHGQPIRRVTLRMDGQQVRWKSPHTWTATPGTHIFHIQVRWGEDKSGKSKPYVLKYAKLEISGNRSKFNHPGIYSSQEELDTIKANINGSAPHPMKLGWVEMINSKSDRITGNMKYSSLDWKPHAVAIVDPKSDDKLKMRDDAIAAYAHALQWVVTGKQAHADKAIEIYNAWSNVFTDMVVNNGDVYPNLFSSWTVNNWAAGAEIIRHYNHGAAKWPKRDIAKFTKMCMVFERLLLEWNGYNGVYGGQNQGNSTARTRMALGVFLDDQALFNEGLRLLYDIPFNDRRIKKRHGHPVNQIGLTVASDGEIMEFNRDAAHGMGSFNMLVNAAEIIRHQKVAPKHRLYDLISENDTVPLLLKGSEYCANSWLNSPIDITTRKAFPNKVRGRNSEFILNYYNYLSNNRFPSPLTQKANDKLRPMPAAGGYALPWSTLTHADLSAKANTKSITSQQKQEDGYPRND